MKKLKVKIARLLTLIALRLSKATVIEESVYSLAPKDGKWHQNSITMSWWANHKSVDCYVDGKLVVKS